MMRFDMRAPGKDAAQRAALYRAAIEMAEWADTRGCLSVSVSEHHAADDGYIPSPFPLAAAMAAVTSNVPITVAAAIFPLYDPVRMAEDMIVLDHISGGRMGFVLGLGYRPVEYELHGVDFAQRGRIADEKLPVLLDTLRSAGATVSAPPSGATDGTSGPAAPLVTPAPFSPGGPLVAWGGATKVAARRAGRNGISFLGQTARPGLQEAYERAARDAGHEPGMFYCPTGKAPLSVFVNDDLDTGWDEVGESLLADAVPYQTWNEEAGMDSFTVSLSRSRTVDELRKEAGSHRVVTVPEAAGIIGDHGSLGLQPLCGGLDPEVAWPYLRRVADDVLPALPR